MSTLFWLAVGAFLGWNFPQPTYAKLLQAYLTKKFGPFVAQVVVLLTNKK